MTTLTPAHEGEVAWAVADAAHAGTPLEITGGGTRLGLGRPVQAERTLSTAGLSGITLYEPGALTLVARAGTPVAEIEAALAAENQMLPFEPMDHRALLGTEGAPTIGGAVAVAAAGPRRIQKGALRDAMIGVGFVDGQGQVIRNGGRVMKNVTGVDLVKLMAGQFGTLGVLTEVVFKLLPAPRATVTLLYQGLDDEAAVALMSAALGAPYDVSGAAHLPGGADEAPGTILRLEGLENSVSYRQDRLGALLRAYGEPLVLGPGDRDPWPAVRDAHRFRDRMGAVWRVSVRPSDGPRLVAALAAGGTDLDRLYDWGGGLVWLLVPDTGDAGAATIRAETARLGGHATLVRATPATRAAVEVFQPEPAPLARIAAGLREKFDPAGILNPGRMG